MKSDFKERLAKIEARQKTSGQERPSPPPSGEFRPKSKGAPSVGGAILRRMLFFSALGLAVPATVAVAGLMYFQHTYADELAAKGAKIDVMEIVSQSLSLKTLKATLDMELTMLRFELGLMSQEELGALLADNGAELNRMVAAKYPNLSTGIVKPIHTPQGRAD